MKKIMLLLIAGFSAMGWLAAQEQHGVCGNSAEDQLLFRDRLISNLENTHSGQVVADRGAIQYVPVHFHLVGDAQGGGKVKELKVLEQVCALNAAYAPMDIRFYLRPHPDPAKGTLFNYTINATNVYSNQTAWLTMNTNRHPNAINIYVVDQAVSGNNNPGVTLAYYSGNRDWIVSRRDYVNGNANNSTIPHEVGHFFSLNHTFYGWESNPFESTDPSWPVAPILSPAGNPTEKANGTNCGTAGDLICDTPPDYNFGLGYGSCTYTAGAKDPTGTIVDPMENNMMGYFETCTEYVFTPQQQTIILADLASSQRNYLDNNFTPVATEIITPADLLVARLPASPCLITTKVLLEWQSVTGAAYYLLEMDIVSSYTSQFAQSFVVAATSKLVTTLQPNRNYYWRVRPFNEYVTCTTPRQRTFRTPTTSAVRSIEGLSAWQIAPNPVSNLSEVALAVTAENNFDATIRVFDAAGRQVYEQVGVIFSAGENRYDLSLGDLKNGLYQVLMQSGNGQSVRKLAVLR
ncbi:MAG: T9SS type A sorting domain-containing protein [Saprospirales bacterium]|nr:T9SS type A sorting domain-containing protein [Saprospirales bacterium]